MFGVFAGGGGFVDGAVAPAIEYALDFAWVFDPGGTVALGVEILGASSWRTARHDRGAGTVVLSIWASDRVSLAFGAGTPVGLQASVAPGGGIAGFARVGYDLIHWPHNALVIRTGLDGDNTPGLAGLQVGVTIGIDGFFGSDR